MEFSVLVKLRFPKKKRGVKEKGFGNDIPT